MDDTPEDAWCKGCAAGCEDLARAANPYPIGSELALDWEDGWRHGERHGYVPEPAFWVPSAQA